MIVEYEQINSISAFDFDGMFLESYSRMENTFLWGPQLTTYEQRKNYYLSQLISAINGTWPLKNDTDTFIMLITKVDDVPAEFSAGFLDADGYLHLRWHLTVPGPTGNRNWRYGPEAHEARKRLVTAINAVGFKEFTWVGSLHYRTLKMRAQTGKFNIVETPIIRDNDPHPDKQLVELTMTLN